MPATTIRLPNLTWLAFVPPVQGCCSGKALQDLDNKIHSIMKIKESSLKKSKYLHGQCALMNAFLRGTSMFSAENRLLKKVRKAACNFKTWVKAMNVLGANLENKLHRTMDGYTSPTDISSKSRRYCRETVQDATMSTNLTWCF